MLRENVVKEKNNKTIKVKRNFKFNIGIIIIFILFIYVLFHVFSFITDKNVSVYEVKTGSINSSNQYNALAIREEEVVNSPQTGIIKYFKQNNSRIGVKTLLYSVDTTGEITNKIEQNSDKNVLISDAQYKAIYNEIYNFVYGYDDSNFNKANIFKTSLNSHLEQISTLNAMNNISPELNQAQQNGQYNLFYGPRDGLFMLTIDGMEDLRIDNFNKDSFDIDKSKKENLANKTSTTQGEPLYKLITSDIWHLVIPIDKDEVEKFENEEYINIRFKQDDVTSYASSSIVQQGSTKYLVLELDDSVERYSDNRFISIELLLDNETGLKIPNSSIVEKEFFTIPKNYFLKGDDSDTEGVMVDKGSSTEFVKPTIFYENDEYYYIDDSKVSSKDYLIKPNSNEKYRVDTKTDSLKGVYNVNKGYAVFKQIQIKNFNHEYSIIETGTPYGITLYDRIVLDSSSIKENELI